MPTMDVVICEYCNEPLMSHTGFKNCLHGFLCGVMFKAKSIRIERWEYKDDEQEDHATGFSSSR